MRSYEEDILRQGFVSYMKVKNSTPEGRNTMFDTLINHIKLNVLDELSEAGSTTLPKNFREMVEERARAEFEKALKEVE